MQNKLVPVFKSLNDSCRVISNCPKPHILPTTETIMYTLLWLYDQNVWFNAAPISSLGTHVVTDEQTFEANDYVQHEGTKVWRKIFEQGNCTTSPEEHMSNMLRKIKDNNDDVSTYVAIYTHLEANMLAQAVNMVDTNQAIEHWVKDEEKWNKIFHPYAKFSNYTEFDQPGPCYRDNHVTEFKPQEDHMTNLSVAIMTNAKVPNPDCKTLYI